MAAVAAIAGCTELAPRVTPEFAAAAQARDPQADPAVLARGREVFVRECAACHALPAPGSTPAADWPHEMAVMGRKSRLTAGDEHATLTYVLAAQSAAGH